MSAEILIPREETCSRCQGSRAEPGSGLVTCQACRGRGEVVYQQSFPVRSAGPARSAAAAASSSASLAASARGQGTVRAERRLKVNVPAGVDSGTHLRLSGEGQAVITAGRREICMSC